jgi:hypothetical protein
METDAAFLRRLKQDSREVVVADFLETLETLGNLGAINDSNFDSVLSECEIIGAMLRDECKAGNMMGMLLFGKLILDHAMTRV